VTCDDDWERRIRIVEALRVCSERGELPIMEYETPSIPD
jgi:hypothetical protein